MDSAIFGRKRSGQEPSQANGSVPGKGRGRLVCLMMPEIIRTLANLYHGKPLRRNFADAVTVAGGDPTLFHNAGIVCDLNIVVRACECIRQAIDARVHRPFGPTKEVVRGGGSLGLAQWLVPRATGDVGCGLPTACTVG
jgi:hypothetical protein